MERINKVYLFKEIENEIIFHRLLYNEFTIHQITIQVLMYFKFH